MLHLKLNRLILSLGLISCAGFKSVKYPYIDPMFYSYVELFETTYHIPVNVSIVFKDIADEDVAGQCWFTSPRLIEIDTPYWNEITDLGKEQLVLHELGHCVLNLEHNESIGTVGAWMNVPLSIMYPVNFGDEPWYGDNRAYYLQELYP